MRLFVAIAVFATGVASAEPMTTEPASGPPPAWVVPQPPLPDAQEAAYRTPRSALLLRDTQILVRGPLTERYEHFAVRINQPAALTAAGAIAISYASSFQQVSLHALAIRRGGEVINLLGKVQFRIVEQEDSLGKHLVVGTRSVIGQVPDLRVGDTLEYGYVISGINPVFGERTALIVPWNFLQPLALRRLRLVEQTPALAPRVISPRGAEIIDIRHVQTSFGKEALLEGRNVLPARLEPSLPKGFDPFVSVALTPFVSWTEVRRWADDLFRIETTQQSPALEQLVKRLKNMTPRRAAVAEAVRFVQDDIRYFSLSIGENSHRPYPPHEVLARRFGDCKDKSLLLVGLLRKLGAEASPALVSSQRRDGIGRFPPLPNVFDHVIVNFRLNGSEYWIDPTRASQGRAFDKQGIALAGAKALRIGTSDEVLTNIPDDEPGTFSVVERLAVTAMDAPVAFQSDIRLTGALADIIRETHTQRSKEGNEAHYQEAFARRYPGARVTRPVQIRDDPVTGALLLTERYEVSDFFRNEGIGKRYAPLGAQQVAAWLDTNVPATRNYPYAIPGGRGSFKYDVEVSFPPDIVGREDPFANHVANDIFQLDTSRSFRGNLMRFSGDLRITRAVVRQEEFADYLEQAKQARRALIDIVVITPENIQANGDEARKSLAQRSQEENRSLVQQIDKVLATGRLGGTEAAEAHIRRATARLNLGELKQAREDLDAALRLKPFSEAAMIGRGLVGFREGRLEAAEEDLTRAITLGAEASNAYLRRGHIRYASGRHAEALADFELAEKANTLGINRDFILIWKLLAMRALGRYISDSADVARAVGQIDRWPNALIALVADKVGIARVLVAADSSSADERSANLCEAHFYIGHYHLLRNERKQAIDSFRSAVATGVIHYMEYEMALVALERLGDDPSQQ